MEDEDEIKIEYNEIYEQDPLSHNFNLQEDVAVKEEIDQRPNEVEENHINEHVIKEESQGTSHEVEERILYEQNTPVDEDSSVGCDQNRDNSTITEMIENNQCQWYKSIDRTGRYLCKYCNLPYSTIQTVRRHTLAKHPAEARELKGCAKYNRRINKCHVCRRKFKTLTDLQYHLKTNHSIGNSYFCHKCQAMFDDKQSLLVHLQLTHKLIGSNVYVCLACGYVTHKVSHFNQHQKIHSQYKTHKCGYCNYATNNMPNLRIHERIHEKTHKQYKCKHKDCIYSATTQSALRSHELIHSKEEHYKYCDKCTYKTVYKQSLKKHIDSHNRNTVKTI